MVDVGIDREIIVVLWLPLRRFFVLDEAKGAFIKLYRVFCLNALLGCRLPFPTVENLASSCFVLHQTKVLEFFCTSQDQIKKPDFLRLRLKSININIPHPSLHSPKLHLLLALFEISKKLKRVVQSSIHQRSTYPAVQAPLVGCFIAGSSSIAISPCLLHYQWMQLSPQLLKLRRPEHIKTSAERLQGIDGRL